MFAFLGPNGAGKTTTVEILECLKTPTSGTVSVLGYDIRKDEKKIKEKIGVMPAELQRLRVADRLGEHRLLRPDVPETARTSTA